MIENDANIPTISVEESANGILKVIDNATRENDGGEFINWDGARFQW